MKKVKSRATHDLNRPRRCDADRRRIITQRVLSIAGDMSKIMPFRGNKISK